MPEDYLDAAGAPSPAAQAAFLAHYARWRADELRQQQADLLRIFHEAKGGGALAGEVEAAIVRWAKLATLIEALDAQADRLERDAG